MRTPHPAAEHCQTICCGTVLSAVLRLEGGCVRPERVAWLWWSTRFSTGVPSLKQRRRLGPGIELFPIALRSSVRCVNPNSGVKGDCKILRSRSCCHIPASEYSPNERLRDPDTTLMTRVLGADAAWRASRREPDVENQDASVGQIAPEHRMPMTQECQRIRRSAWPGGAKLHAHGSVRPAA